MHLKHQKYNEQKINKIKKQNNKKTAIKTKNKNQ